MLLLLQYVHLPSVHELSMTDQFLFRSTKWHDAAGYAVDPGREVELRLSTSLDFWAQKFVGFHGILWLLDSSKSSAWNDGTPPKLTCLRKKNSSGLSKQLFLEASTEQSRFWCFITCHLFDHDFKGGYSPSYRRFEFCWIIEAASLLKTSWNGDLGICWDSEMRWQQLITHFLHILELQLRSNGLNPGVAMKGRGFGGSLVADSIPCSP